MRSGDRMRNLRRELGNLVIGRDLSPTEFAHLCGLWVDLREDDRNAHSGAHQVLRWERGAEPSGPIKQLLRLYATVFNPAEPIEVRDYMTALIRERVNSLSDNSDS